MDDLVVDVCLLQEDELLRLHFAQFGTLNAGPCCICKGPLPAVDEIWIARARQVWYGRQARSRGDGMWYGPRTTASLCCCEEHAAAKLVLLRQEFAAEVYS